MQPLTLIIPANAILVFTWMQLTPLASLVMQLARIARIHPQTV